MNIDLEKGDEILTGKFKNHKATVKSIGKDDKNQPTINDKPMLKFRIAKTMKEDTESIIKRYGLFGKGLLLSFKNDPAEYILKGLAPDRLNVFVSLKNQLQTYRKSIKNLEKVNRKPIVENNDYLKEKEMPNNIGHTKHSAETDFIPELSFALRGAYTMFSDALVNTGITKENPEYNIQFKQLYPTYMQTTLAALYYKFTKGRYQYLNNLTFEQFYTLVATHITTTSGSEFFNDLKNVVLSSAKDVVAELPKQQEGMKESKDLKIKVLLEKVLLESNEMRGYYDYEYDVKSKQLKCVGNGVCSEYGIGNEYSSSEFLRAYNSGVLHFRESPSMDTEEIMEMINYYIQKYINGGK